MRNLVVIAVLCAALPLAALPAATQAQDKSQDNPPKPAAPTLEKPGMAPATDTPAPAPAKKPAAPPAAAPAATEGKTVEEIIARVNNEIITRSEFEKARQTAADDAREECQTRCTPEQLQINIE